MNYDCASWQIPIKPYKHIPLHIITPDFQSELPVIL